MYFYLLYFCILSCTCELLFICYFPRFLKHKEVGNRINVRGPRVKGKNKEGQRGFRYAQPSISEREYARYIIISRIVGNTRAQGQLSRLVPFIPPTPRYPFAVSPTLLIIVELIKMNLP